MILFYWFVIVLCWRYCPGGSTGLREEFTWSKITFAITESRFYRPKNVGAFLSGDALTFPGKSSASEESTNDARNLNNEYIFGKY